MNSLLNDQNKINFYNSIMSSENYEEFVNIMNKLKCVLYSCRHTKFLEILIINLQLYLKNY